MFVPPKLLPLMEDYYIARYHEMDRVGPVFWKPCSLVWKPSPQSLMKLGLMIICIALKFNGWRAKILLGLICWVIVACRAYLLVSFWEPRANSEWLTHNNVSTAVERFSGYTLAYDSYDWRLTGLEVQSHICDHSNDEPPCKLTILCKNTNL